MGDQPMCRGEPSRKISKPSAPNEGTGMAKLHVEALSMLPGRTARARKKPRLSMALVDPKPLTRRSLAKMLSEALPDYQMITASTCQELLQIQGGPIDSPHLIIVYVRGASVTHVCVQNALELVRLRLPEAPVIVLSDRDDVDDINGALTCGVRGYIPTSVEAEVAFAALRLINAGGIFIPAHPLRSATSTPDPAVEAERRGLADELDLTPREFSVLDLLREGKPNKLIAAGLNMGESTVKVHVRNILKKLHAANRTQAASVANHLLGRQVRTDNLLSPETDAGSASKARHSETVGG
jgi:DNA-binding NarL/FixJ family response regulator